MNKISKKIIDYMTINFYPNEDINNNIKYVDGFKIFWERAKRLYSVGNMGEITHEMTIDNNRSSNSEKGYIEGCYPTNLGYVCILLLGSINKTNDEINVYAKLTDYEYDDRNRNLDCLDDYELNQVENGYDGNFFPYQLFIPETSIDYTDYYTQCNDSDYDNHNRLSFVEDIIGLHCSVDENMFEKSTVHKAIFCMENSNPTIYIHYNSGEVWKYSNIHKGIYNAVIEKIQ